ncbi:MAG: hypothetical protein Q8L66_01270 [Caulobacter sp.]|nr:hypothetical protein [Caulobacter sp.]MDP1962664.1 hypothetical protein [Reyranella sp.]
MRTWKIVFALAAAFNFLVGLPLLLAPSAFYAALKQPIPTDLMSLQTSALLISVFGVGYAMLAVDPVRNRPIAWLGLLGKAPLPVMVWLQVQAGKAAVSAFQLTLVDLVFAVLFAVFILRTRRPAA